MADLTALVMSVLEDRAAQESDWLEWKSQADLSQRLWQARIARFILAAANRPVTSSALPYQGSAFLLLGVEPGNAHGVSIVDPAVIEQCLARFLGPGGPVHRLDYVAIGSVTVAVVTVAQPVRGSRPYLARGSFSAERPEIQDGRIYIRRPGVTKEAVAAEVDEMLTERVAARVAAGPLWPMQAEPAWRDGDAIHVRRGPRDRLVIEGPDVFTNLANMAAHRPALPSNVPSDVTQRLAGFDSLLARADSEPVEAIKDAWTPLRAIVVEAYEQHLGPRPLEGYKVVDMVTDLAQSGFVEPGWVDVSYPLYYWAISEEARVAGPGVAKSYLTLAKALATALLLLSECEQSDD